MKKLKKLITLVAAMCMIFSMATVVFASDEIVTINGQLSYEQAIAAGDTVTFNAYGVSGTILTIYDEDAIVTYGGEDYEAVDGLVEVSVTSSNRRMPVEFQLTNGGDEDKTFELEFVYPVGSQQNPEKISESASIFAEIEEGNSQGYFVNFTAPADGIFSFTIYGADIYNEETEEYTELGWMYNINQLTKSKYGDIMRSTDDEVVSSQEFEVEEGDEIEIVLLTLDPEGGYTTPAGSVSAYIDFVYPEGSIDNPIGIWETPTEIEVEADSELYYQGYFAGQTVTFTGTGVSVIYKDKTYTTENGVITIECPAQGMGRPMPDVFQIINDDTTAATVKVDAKYPAGHNENPADLVIGKNKADIVAGTQGYYYKWIATKSGLFTVEFDGEADWMYTVNNMTTYEYGDTVWSDSNPAMPSTTIVVKEGDEIWVIVNTYNPEDEWNNPEGTVEFTASLESNDVIADLVGTKDEAEDIEELFASVTVTDSEGNELVATTVKKDDLLAILELADDLNKFYAMDITLVDEYGLPVQPEEGTTVKVTMNVPFKLEGAKLVEVFWLNEGKLESLGKVEVVDGKISFDAKHFSAYVFADVTPVVEDNNDVNTPDNGDTDQNVKPGDTANVAMLLVVVAVAAVAVVLTKKKTVVE